MIAIAASILFTAGACSWIEIIIHERPIGDGSNPRLLSWRQALTISLPMALFLGPCMWIARLYNEFSNYGPNE